MKSESFIFLADTIFELFKKTWVSGWQNLSILCIYMISFMSFPSPCSGGAVRWGISLLPLGVSLHTFSSLSSAIQNSQGPIVCSGLLARVWSRVVCLTASPGYVRSRGRYICHRSGQRIFFLLSLLASPGKEAVSNWNKAEERHGSCLGTSKYPLSLLWPFAKWRLSKIEISKKVKFIFLAWVARYIFLGQIFVSNAKNDPRTLFEPPKSDENHFHFH